MFWSIPGCPQGVPGMFQGQSGSVPRCSGPVPGFTDTPWNYATVNLFHAACSGSKQQQQQTSKPLLDTFKRAKMIDLLLFATDKASKPVQHLQLMWPLFKLLKLEVKIAANQVLFPTFSF